MIKHTFHTVAGAGTIIGQAITQAETAIDNWLAEIEGGSTIIQTLQVSPAIHFAGAGAFSKWMVVLTANISYEEAEADQ